MKYARMEAERRRLLNAASRRLDGGTDDIATAAHEGSHILVGWLVGFDPVYATIDPQVGSDGMASFGRGAISATMDRQQAFNHAIVRLAGVEGEKLAGHDGCGKDDLLQARTALGRINRSAEVVDVLVNLARAQARRFLEENFAMLLRVVAALLEKRSINADQIAELLASKMPDDDADDDDEEESKTSPLDGDAAGDGLMLRAILPAITGTVLHGAAEPIPTQQCRELVYYGEAG
jgi:hypothetical protein